MRRAAPASPARPVTGALLLVALGLGCGSGQGAGRGLVALGAQGESDGRPTFHDFGNVEDGAVVTHVFRLENRDAAPVRITQVVPGCGCTVPTLRYRAEDGTLVQGESIRSDAETLLAVPPGRVAEIEIRIDTHDVRQKNTHHLYATRVSTDSDATAFVTLETHILVERAFQVVPTSLDLGRVAQNGGGSGELEIVTLSGYDARVVEVLESEGPFRVELAPEDRLGQRLWRLRAALDPPLAPGRVDGTVQLATQAADGHALRPLEIGMTALVVPDIEARPARLIVVEEEHASGPACASVQVASLLPGQRIRVVSAEVEPENAAALAVRATPVEPDARGNALAWTIELCTRAGAPGDVRRGRVRVTLDDPQNPLVEIPYVVHRR